MLTNLKKDNINRLHFINLLLEQAASDIEDDYELSGRYEGSFLNAVCRYLDRYKTVEEYISRRSRQVPMRALQVRSAMRCISLCLIRRLMLWGILGWIRRRYLRGDLRNNFAGFVDKVRKMWYNIFIVNFPLNRSLWGTKEMCKVLFINLDLIVVSC